MENSQLKDIRNIKTFCFIGCAALFIFLYVYGALEHSKIINLDVDASDQAAYLSYAKNLYETDYNMVGGRNRMPVYPMLLSLIYSPDLTENQFFIRSKAFNIALSAALLPGLFWLFRKTLPFILSVNLWLITAFTVFIFKAGYAQTELLFYFLNFCAFLLMYQMLKKPELQFGILTGIVLGIAHLTKASVMPGLFIFAVFFIAKEIYSLYFNFNRINDDKTQRFSKNLFHLFWQIRQETALHLLSLALVFLTFLSVIYPYISTSQRFFGQPFYNVNSNFYIWYDSWEEAEAGTRLHGDNKGWPEMPAQQIPSAKKYLQEHTVQQILDRPIRGIKKVLLVAYKSYGYLKYVLIYAVFALVLTLLNFQQSLAIVKRHPFLILFCLSYFFVYLLIYAWYVPVASGNRFTLALFMPLMFFLATIIHTQSRYNPPISIYHVQIKWFELFNFATLGILLFELHSILTDRIVTLFAGS